MREAFDNPMIFADDGQLIEVEVEAEASNTDDTPQQTRPPDDSPQSMQHAQHATQNTPLPSHTQNTINTDRTQQSQIAQPTGIASTTSTR